MKIVKTRYDYIFLIYVPIALAGVCLGLFFARALLHVIPILMLLFFCSAILIALSPYGKQRILNHDTPRYSTLRWLSLSVGLQIALSLIFCGFAQTAIIQQPNLIFWQGGFYPWSFYVTVGIALIYLTTGKKHPATIRTAVHPIFKKIADGIIGYGIEVFIKQGLILVTALTIVIDVLQISQVINLKLALPLLPNKNISIILLGTLLFCLSGSPMAQRGMHYLWTRQYSIRIFFSIFSLLLLVILLVFAIGAKLFTIVFPHLTLSTQQLNFLHPTDLFNQALLLNAGWWFAWTPLIAALLIKFARGRSVRAFILANLTLPICFGLMGWLSEHSAAGAYLQTTVNLFNLWPIALLAALLSLILVIRLFRDPETEGLTAATSERKSVQHRSTLALMYSSLQLSVALLVLYLFSNLSFIALFMTGIALPIFLSSVLACIGAILISLQNKSLFKEK